MPRLYVPDASTQWEHRVVKRNYDFPGIIGEASGAAYSHSILASYPKSNGVGIS